MKSAIALAGLLMFSGAYAAYDTELGNRFDPYVTYEEIEVLAPEIPVMDIPEYGDRFDPYVVDEQIEVGPEKPYPDEPTFGDRFDPYSGVLGE